VKNAKYSGFMQPGRRLDLAVDLVKIDGPWATFKGKGIDDAGQPTVTAQFVLHGYNLAEKGPAGQRVEDGLREHWKNRWALLCGELN